MIIEILVAIAVVFVILAIVIASRPSEFRPFPLRVAPPSLRDPGNK